MRYAVIGFFAAVIAGIVFVQAGSKGGSSAANGGEQAASIIYAAGSSVSQMVQSLETGSR